MCEDLLIGNRDLSDVIWDESAFDQSCNHHHHICIDFDLCNFTSDMFLFRWISVVYQQLLEYEQKIFGTIENSGIVMPSLPSLSFGFSRPIDPPVPVPAPVFNNTGSASIFTRPSSDITPQEFTFGAVQTQKNTPDDTGFSTNATIPAVNDISMDGNRLASDHTFLWKRMVGGRLGSFPTEGLNMKAGMQS